MIVEIVEYLSNHCKETVFTVLRLVAIWFLIGGIRRRPRHRSK